jgi:hypothetical protein
VQADIGKLILEHLEEHGKEMVNSSEVVSSRHNSKDRNLLLLAEDRSKTTDLGSKGSSNVLGSIRHKVLYSCHDIIK